MMTSYTGTRESLISSDETNLVVAAQKGDMEAFNQLVLSYQDRIFNLAVRVVGDSALAEDITQSTFLTAYLDMPCFRNGSFRVWLYRIATNACYDEYRQRKRYSIQSIEDENLIDKRLLSLNDYSYANFLPELEYEERKLAQLVQYSLNRLDVEQRTVVVLVDQHDFDYQEAAQVLGIPIGTVKSRLARARMRVQQLLNYSIIANR